MPKTHRKKHSRTNFQFLATSKLTLNEKYEERAANANEIEL